MSPTPRSRAGLASAGPSGLVMIARAIIYVAIYVDKILAILGTQIVSLSFSEMLSN